MAVDLSLFQPRNTFGSISLESLLCSPEYFGLITASPLQRAICRILDGLPLAELATDPNVIAALGGEAAIPLLPASKPKQMLLLAGIRSGKSLLAAAAVVRAALTCDVSRLGPGEIPRAAIVSLTRDTAQPALDHVIGRITASPKLNALLIGKPKADSLQLRHPTGRPIEVTVVAGARAAGTLIARWLAGVIFDESPRMIGAEEGVVNLEDQLVSIAGRMLPGAQVIMSGSPWASFGPCYEMSQQHLGTPSERLVVVRAMGPQLNPVHWTPEKCAELQARDPDAYRVDVLCEFLDPVAGLFSTNELEACITHDTDSEPPRAGHYYTAAIDPATRGNAWTVVVVEHTRGGAARVVLAKQWVGSVAEPLSPKATFAELAELLKPYACNAVYTDQWAADALVEIAAECGLWLISEATTDKSKLESFKHLGARVADRTLELPRVRDLIRDLASVRRKTTATGVSIHLPLNAAGRHCDYAPALALALQHMPREPESVQSLQAAAGAPELSEDKRRAMQAVALQQRNADAMLRRSLGLD